jgi:hypothetical protein
MLNAAMLIVIMLSVVAPFMEILAKNCHKERAKKLYSIGSKSCLCKIFTFETKASFIGASCQKLSPSFYPSQLGPINKLIPTDI